MQTGARLRRLRIDRFRNVVPGTELVFHDGFNVLLGQNGTGKTTLLNLIAAVVRWDFSVLRDTDFAIGYDLIIGDVRLDVGIDSKQGSGTPEALQDSLDQLTRLPTAHREDLSSSRWSYTITLYLSDKKQWEFKTDALGAKLKFVGATESEAAVPIVTPFEPRFIIDAIGPIAELADPTILRPFALILRAIAFSTNHGRFDEALGAVQSITENVGTAGLGSLHGSEVFTRKNASRDHSYSGLFTFVPTELWLSLTKDSPELIGRESITIPHTRLSFLAAAVSLLGSKHADMILRRLSKEVKGSSETFTYSKFGFSFTLEDGSIITHDLLSYGQKRLLAFLYYAAANPDIVIADELVNGLHYDWIEACLKTIRDRQSFLTSQNPVLLDFLPFQSAEEVQRTFILCRRQVKDGHVQLSWQNMSAQSAESFFRSYKTEALQVSEILRARGLW